MPSIGSKQRAKRREEKLASRTAEEVARDEAEASRKQGVGVTCEYCGRGFPSRNKMFKHLQGRDGGEECMMKARDAGMPIAKQTERVALLLVYAGENYAGAGASYQGHHWQSFGIHGKVERLLWNAAHAVDGHEGAPGKVKQFTRASRTDRGLHSLGNVVCLAVNKIVDPAAAQVWVQQVNAHLPEDIRVLGRWPVENDFHAKNSVEKRRYEMLVPLHTLVAENPAAAVEASERSAQAEWRWEQSVCTVQLQGWTITHSSTSNGPVTVSCDPAGLAVYVPVAATALIQYTLPRPALLTDDVYAEWWQQHIDGAGAGPSAQLVLGVSGSATGEGSVDWFASAERFETASALDSLHQRELKVCQPFAARMGWLGLDCADGDVLCGAEPQRLPSGGIVLCIGWLVQGKDAEATALRFSGLRIAECSLRGPFQWHANATTTDRLCGAASAVAENSAKVQDEQGRSPENKRMRAASDDVAAMRSEQSEHGDGQGPAAGIRHWALYRLRLLARLKSLIKKFEGDALHAYHNFSEGVSSTEARAKKRVSRFYCRGIVQLGPSLECVVLTFQALEDGFLYNQLRKIVGLLVTVARGDVPDSYIKLALDENVVLPVPCAPVHLGAIADCIYSRKISRAKFGEPGEIKQPTGDRDNSVNFNSYRQHETTAWRAHLHAHMAKLERSSDLPAAELAKGASDGAGDTAVGGRWDQWVQNVLYDESSATCVTRMTRELTFYQSKQRGASPGVRPPISTAVPPAFRHMLYLLREAEQSGRWPASSVSRRNVIDKNSRRGESFALGRMPAHLKQPTANELFPELLQAAMALEHVLLPTRPPSSTIVVNKHAQFKPHKDSGAGAGQHVSMIVGLGEYRDGELVVEGNVNDIRYKALEFDGWNQRHWTLPFEGERFSIVWFTPLGCEDMAPTTSEVAEAVSACEVSLAARAGTMVPRVVPDDSAEQLPPSLEHPEWAVELHSRDELILGPEVDATKVSDAPPADPILMPLVGIGTYRVRGLDTNKVISAALSAGCRLIDTAASYGNEAEIGAVLRDEGSLKGDHAVHREHIFLTSKLRPQDAGYDKTLKAFDASIERLGVDYLDLYLIHWPGTAKLAPASPAHKENRLGSWVLTYCCCCYYCRCADALKQRAMQELQASAKVRAIGVSNFTISHLKELIDDPGTHIIPAVNQVEFHPLIYSVQRPLLEFCREHGIVLQAYAPLGSKDGVSQVLNHPTITAIATKHGVTAAEVALRWALNHGVSVLPKSSHSGRIHANAAPSLLSTVRKQPLGIEHAPLKCPNAVLAEDAPNRFSGCSWVLSTEDMQALDSVSGCIGGAGESSAVSRFCWDPSNIV